MNCREHGCTVNMRLFKENEIRLLFSRVSSDVLNPLKPNRI
jgi:hypothetical protein